ncbi:FUSC family protein [Streptomyces sp. NPDC004629]|uniref:FUSC family protein n=1 Tax=Streptomyces sp. NPDC004629 TaxID=3364705 RepID=UPI003694F8E1
MAVALVAGLCLAQPQVTIPLAVGSLYASANDTERGYGDRVRHIACPVLGGAMGIAVGFQLRVATPFVALAVTVAVALCAGMISTVGPTASAAGLQLLVMAALGQGLPGRTASWWQPAVLLLCGAAPVLLLALAPAVRGLHGPARRSLARAYAAQAQLLGAIGTPEAAAARRAATDALNAVEQDLPHVWHCRRGQAHTTGGCRRCQLLGLADDLRTASEAAAALTAGAEPVPEPFRAAASDVGCRLQIGNGPPWRPRRRRIEPKPRDLSGATGDSPLLELLASAYTAAQQRLQPHAQQGYEGRRHMRGASAHARVSACHRRAGVDGRRLLRPGIRKSTPFGADGFWRTALDYGLRVALCAGLAVAAAELLHPHRGYWLLLTVALVVKPDAGSVLVRGLHRTLGTLAGVLLTTVLLSLVHDRIDLAAAAVVATALVPFSSARSYGQLTTVVAPVVFVLLSLSGVSAATLVGERVTDTLAGVAICVTAGHMLWPLSRRHHTREPVIRAVRALASYLDQTSCPPPSQERHVHRRVAYRALAKARHSLEPLLAEPMPARHDAEELLRDIHCMEHLADAATARALQSFGGGAKGCVHMYGRGDPSSPTQPSPPCMTLRHRFSPSSVASHDRLRDRDHRRPGP